MTTAQVDEVLHDVFADQVGQSVDVVMRALNKRGTTRVHGRVVSVHRHGFVIGEERHRVFVTFADLFCQAAQVVEGGGKEDVLRALVGLRSANPAPAPAPAV